MAGPGRPEDPDHFDWGAGVVGPTPAGQASGAQAPGPGADPGSPGWAYPQGWQPPSAPAGQTPSAGAAGWGQTPPSGQAAPTDQPPANQPPYDQPTPPPGYGPPPPGYGPPPPGWGAPPPGYGPPPPGWGAPPPGYQQYPGYAPTGYQAGWPPQPQPASSTRGKGCLIAAIAATAVVALLVAGCVALVVSTLVPAVDTTAKIRDRSDGMVQSASYNWVNGHGEFDIRLAPGVAASDAQAVACHVVPSVLHGTQFEHDSFYIYDSTGFLVADYLTPCG